MASEILENGLLDRLNAYANSPDDFTQDSCGSLMKDAFNHLARVSTYAGTQEPGGNSHWYCERASPVTRESATFLIRAHAFNGERVESWKSQCAMILSECVGCCGGYQHAKVVSKAT